MSHQDVFAAAAAVAKELRVAVMQRRERVAAQLAGIDAELARLDTVISFESNAPATPKGNGSAPGAKKLPKGTWQARIDDILGAAPLRLTELAATLKNKHGVPFSEKYLSDIMDRGQRRKRWYKDEERRWHNVPKK